MAFWASIAELLKEPLGLRTADLNARFSAVFQEGVVVVRLSNGVERRIDLPELRAAWRLLDAGKEVRDLRPATPNGVYISALRLECLRRSIALDQEEGDTAIDDGGGTSGLEHELVTQATVLASPRVAGQSRDELLALLDEALGRRDDFAREAAGLRADLVAARDRIVGMEAQIEALHERLEHELEMTRSLEDSLARAASRKTVVPISERPVHPLRAYVEWLMQSIDDGSLDPVVAGKLKDGIRTIETAPKSTLVDVREALEHLAFDAWSTVNGARATGPLISFSKLMGEVAGRPGIDVRAWHLAMTLHGECSRYLHRPRPGEPPTPPPTSDGALMAVLALVRLRNGLTYD